MKNKQQVICFMSSLGYKHEERNGEIYFFNEEVDMDFESAFEYWEHSQKFVKETAI